MGRIVSIKATSHAPMQEANPAAQSFLSPKGRGRGGQGVCGLQG